MDYFLFDFSGVQFHYTMSQSIKYLQEHTSIRGLDLSRGDERYKLEMGGVRHYNYRFEIQL